MALDLGSVPDEGWEGRERDCFIDQVTVVPLDTTLSGQAAELKGETHLLEISLGSNPRERIEQQGQSRQEEVTQTTHRTRGGHNRQRQLLPLDWMPRVQTDPEGGLSSTPVERRVKSQLDCHEL